MSTPRSRDLTIKVPMSASELAMLHSATSLARGWSFERPSAQAMLHARGIPRSADREKIRETNDHVFRELKHVHSVADMHISSARLWSSDSQDKMVSALGEISLTEEQIHWCLFSLRLCHEEFSVNWGEFGVLAPGNIDCYGAIPDDLLALAGKLENFRRYAGE